MPCNSLMIVSSLFSLPPPTSGASVAPPAQNLTTTAGGLTTAGCDHGTIRIVLKILTIARWEMDCPLDRYCLKVSGTVVDAYGYGRQVAVRGCPLISLLTRLEEGCHRLG